MDFQTYITLDWDNNQKKYILQNRERLIQEIFDIAGEIEVLEGIKGIGWRIKLKEVDKISYAQHFFLRMRLGDDLFRCRADIDKVIRNEQDRINRIWKVKDKTIKKQLYKGEANKFIITDMIEHFLKKTGAYEDEEDEQEELKYE